MFHWNCTENKCERPVGKHKFKQTLMFSITQEMARSQKRNNYWQLLDQNNYQSHDVWLDMYFRCHKAYV